MNIIVVVLIIYIVIILIAYFILKRIVKAIFIAGIVLTIAAIILGIAVFFDMRDIQSNFQTSPKLMLMEHNNEVVAGFIAEEEATSLTKEQILVFSDYLKADDYKKLLGENYKVLTYSVDLIESFDDFSITILGTTFYKSEIVKIMKNEGKAKYWAEELFITDYYELRNFLFSEIINQKLSGTENIIYFVDGLKTEEIKIYPESVVFKTIKVIPTSWVKERIKYIS